VHRDRFFAHLYLYSLYVLLSFFSYWSPPTRTLLFFVVDSVCLYVLGVTLLQIVSSFLFVDGIEPFFGRQFSMWHSTKLFLTFLIYALTPQIWKKSPITRLTCYIDRRCLHLPGSFRDGRFNGTMQNVVGPTLVAMATTIGLGAEI